MKAALVLVMLVICGCANYGARNSAGFTCMADAESCERFLRTGGVPEPSQQATYRPSQSFTIIHSNRGPTTIYRQGNTYWVNSKVR